MEKTSTTTFRHAAIWLGIAAFLFILWKTAEVILIVFAGLLVALMFASLAGLFRTHLGMARKWALALAYAIVFTIIILAIVFGGMTLVQQAGELWGALLEQLRSLTGALDTMGMDGEKGRDESSPMTLSSILPDPGRLMGTFVSPLFTAFGALGNLVVIIFVAVFVSWNPDLYRRGLVSLVPPKHRTEFDDTLVQATDRLASWLKGQGLAMLTVFFATWLILWLIGMPYSFVLAIQAGALAFIQTIGPMISGLAIIATGFSVSGSMALWGLGAYILIQVVESNLTTPLIQREMASVPPAMTLVSQLLFGTLFGFIGLALAVPFMLVVMVFVQRLYVERQLGGSFELGNDRKVRED